MSHVEDRPSQRSRRGPKASSLPVILSLLLPALLLATPLVACGQGQTRDFYLSHAGYLRHYQLYVPADYPSARTDDWPLVFNVHGALTPLATQARWTGMNAVADAQHFLVAYPEGIGGHWLGPEGPNKDDPYDDVGFIDDVIRQVTSGYEADARKVYATGFSEGAVMVHVLAARRPHTYGAIAAVSAMRPYYLGTTTYAPKDLGPTPTRPFPLLQVHGTGDVRVPYFGGDAGDWSWPPVETLVADFVAGNNCDPDPEVFEFPNIDGDKTTVQLRTYANGDTYVDAAGNLRHSEVLFYSVEGGGHSWPALFTTTYPPYCYPVNHDIDLSGEIWKFFSRHEVPIPEPVAGLAAWAGVAAWASARGRAATP